MLHVSKLALLSFHIVVCCALRAALLAKFIIIPLKAFAAAPTTSKLSRMNDEVSECMSVCVCVRVSEWVVGWITDMLRSTRRMYLRFLAWFRFAFGCWQGKIAVQQQQQQQQKNGKKKTCFFSLSVLLSAPSFVSLTPRSFSIWQWKTACSSSFHRWRRRLRRWWWCGCGWGWQTSTPSFQLQLLLLLMCLILQLQLLRLTSFCSLSLSAALLELWLGRRCRYS